MLFNSYEFIFLFLPISFLLYLYGSQTYGREFGLFTLVASSLFFYAWWSPVYVSLLVSSIVFNFYLGKYLSKNKGRLALYFSVAINLFVIGYYKYSGFFVDNVNVIFGTSIDIGNVILPLAISFFTFQQIAYLVDSYYGVVEEYNFLHYSLFVLFFPQLIAGPIVHHKQMLPQFFRDDFGKVNCRDLVVGISIFSIGLLKKTVIADGISIYADPVFSAVNAGGKVDFFQAWGGALSYTFQLYFDFSGYSDMAIGLARVFGVVLPLNFYSPYKSANIIEFWRRWHITLSNFLRDYLYISLGGNRKGKSRRYFNLFITMLLGGLWHGAGWNFVIWGALHGCYLSINHFWKSLKDKAGFTLDNSSIYIFLSWFITFVVVVFGWVFFRSTNLDSALAMVQSMTLQNGVQIPSAIVARLEFMQPLLSFLHIGSSESGGSQFIKTWLWIFILLFCVLVLPNTQDIFHRAQGSLSSIHFDNKNVFWPRFNAVSKLVWDENKVWALLTSLAFVFGILTLSQVSECLYFRF